MTPQESALEALRDTFGIEDDDTEVLSTVEGILTDLWLAGVQAGNGA